MFACDTNSFVDFRMGWPLGIRNWYLHMSHSTTCMRWRSFWTLGNFHAIDPFGCSNTTRLPDASWISISSQQKLMNSMVSLCFSATSSGLMYIWFKLNHPPAHVHGGHNASSSGAVSLINFFIFSRWDGFLKSQPVTKSADKHVWPLVAVCWANLGGENTAITSKGLL